MKALYTTIAGILFCTVALAQQADTTNESQSVQAIWSINFDYGSAVVHTYQVEAIRGSKPRGMELSYARLLTGKNVWDKWGFFTQSGFSATYFDYNRSILGYSYSLSYFVKPTFRLSKSLMADITGSVGLSWLSNPFDSITNATNQNYSTHINSFLRVGTGIHWSVGSHWQLNGSAYFNHHSNGGYQQPNRGLNYVTVALGVSYYTQHTRLPVYTRTKDDSWKKNKYVWLEGSAFYSPKQGYDSNWKAGRKFLGGATLQLTRQVSQVSAVSVAAEIFYDGAVHSIKQNIHDSTSSTFAGILAGHAFLINRLVFSQQLGLYVFKQTQFYADNYLRYAFHPFYQRWGLNYRISGHWLAGFNLLAHLNVADFIDIRACYRF